MAMAFGQSMTAMRNQGMSNLPDTMRGPLGCAGFSSQSVSNDDTRAEMQLYYAQTGGLICPHTAVGTAIARSLPSTEAVTVVLSTAHAAKFPETVLICNRYRHTVASSL